MATFKVFDAEVLPLGEVAVIVTTAWFNAGGYPKAEAFLILPDEKHTVVANELAFDAQTFEDSPLTLDENYMLDEALNQAVIDLRLYIADFAQRKQIQLPFSTPPVVPHNWNHLVYLWARGKHAEALKTIKDKTEVIDLAEKIQLAMSILPVTVRAIQHNSPTTFGHARSYVQLTHSLDACHANDMVTHEATRRQPRAAAKNNRSVTVSWLREQYSKNSVPVSRALARLSA